MTTRAAWARACLFAGLPLLLIGCTPPDGSRPDAEAQRQEDTFRPKGINAANLAAMVADPADLVRGHDATTPGRKMGAQAVIRLWEKPPAGLQPSTASTGSVAPDGMQPLAGGQQGSGSPPGAPAPGPGASGGS
jgi:hypothetical protein